MKPVDQTEFGVEVGNCVSACIASIFELDIEDVPNFWHDTQDALEFWKMLNNWMVENLEYKCVPIRVDTEHLYLVENVLCLAFGQSPRDIPHAVVCYNSIIHDPHPDKKGLKDVPEDYCLLVPLIPFNTEV